VCMPNCFSIAAGKVFGTVEACLPSYLRLCLPRISAFCLSLSSKMSMSRKVSFVGGGPNGTEPFGENRDLGGMAQSPSDQVKRNRLAQPRVPRLQLLGLT
jgi:hypothetical protein